MSDTEEQPAGDQQDAEPPQMTTAEVIATLAEQAAEVRFEPAHLPQALREILLVNDIVARPQAHASSYPEPPGRANYHRQPGALVVGLEASRWLCWVYRQFPEARPGGAEVVLRWWQDSPGLLGESGWYPMRGDDLEDGDWWIYMPASPIAGAKRADALEGQEAGA